MRPFVPAAILTLGLGAAALAAPASASAQGSPAVVPAHECAAEGATLVWGLKASFRDYISGSIAKGDIEGIDGVEVVDGVYEWSDGEGSFDEHEGLTEVSFEGGVHFTGHKGLLDLVIENPVFTADGDGTGTLTVDVYSKALEGEDVDEKGVVLAELTLEDAEVTDGELVWTEAPAQLTEEGAAGFAGFYEAGAELDPVTVTVPVVCEEEPAETTAPAVTDPTQTAASGQQVSTGSPEGLEAASDDVPVIPIVVGAGVAVVVAAAVVLIVVSRRRKS